MLQSSVSEVWDYLEERFGVSREDLKGFRIEEIAGDYWLISRDLETDYETKTRGIRFVRRTGRGLKPTTYGIQFLGDRIDRNIVELEEDEIEGMLMRTGMPGRDMDEKGYVALKFRGKMLGCGFYMDEKVSSRIPKGRAKELAQIIL
ncbi:MAG: hypothetical protein ABEJ99_04895 [Candidatus Nanohaloarchaea archaeon]